MLARQLYQTLSSSLFVCQLNATSATVKPLGVVGVPLDSPFLSCPVPRQPLVVSNLLLFCRFTSPSNLSSLSSEGSITLRLAARLYVSLPLSLFLPLFFS